MKVKLFPISVLALFPVSGCEEKNPSIVTTVYSIQYLVEGISGGDVTVSNITENTMIQCTQIKSSFQNVLKDSGTLFCIGGLEPYIDLYMNDVQDTGADMVDLATKSAIYKFERYTSTTIDDITAGTGGLYYEEEEFANLDTYDADPVLWMGPVAMTGTASDIRDYLVQEHSQCKGIFDEDYDALELDLARLEMDFQATSDGKMNINFASMTPSFGNWQKSYGIKVYSMTLSRYKALPTSDQLAVIKKRIKSDHM